MPNDENAAPRRIHGVMLSSTFTDLEQHRAALIKAIKGEGLTDVAMENDSAKPDVDVIDSSLRMVQEASAYIGVISRRYGQTPSCPKRNPNELSMTELEFNEAQGLGRPSPWASLNSSSVMESSLGFRLGHDGVCPYLRLITPM